MKSFQLLIICLFVFSSSWCQPKRADADIKAIFSSKDNVDFKFSNGSTNLDEYNYYLSGDTLFYTYNHITEPIPLKIIDFATYSIEEDNTWMTEKKEKIFQLTLKAVKGKKFTMHFSVQSQLLTEAFGSETNILLFPTRSMAVQAFEYLKNAALGLTTENKESSNENLLHKVLADKDDVDFEFALIGKSYSPSPFKYYYHNDSLWFYGTEFYSIVIPVNAIDFSRTIYYLESGVWQNKIGNKCIEVPLYAIKGKLYKQEFDNTQYEQHFGGKNIDFAELVLPDKTFAEELIKFLKAQQR